VLAKELPEATESLAKPLPAGNGVRRACAASAQLDVVVAACVAELAEIDGGLRRWADSAAAADGDERCGRERGEGSEVDG